MSGYHRYDLNFGGGVVGVVISHLTFMFECQGWCGVGVLKKWENFFTDSKLNVEHPQHLSHIYDTLTFMFECWG